MKLVFSLSFFILLYSSPSWALSLICRSLNLSFTSPYVFNNTPGTNPQSGVTITVTRANNATLTSACNGFIAFNAGQNDSPTYTRRLRRNSNYINYNLYKQVGLTNTFILEACGTADPNKQIAFTIPIGQTTATVSPVFYPGMTTPTPGAFASGSYTDTVSVRTYEGSIGSCTLPGGTMNIQTQLRVDQTLDISPVSQTMNLGTLSVGATATSSFTITHNGGGFKVGVKSANGSLLKKAGTSHQWPYQVQFKRGGGAFGTALSLSSSWIFATDLTQGATGAPVVIQTKVNVVSPAPSNPLAGTYSDVISYEVVAP